MKSSMAKPYNPTASLTADRSLPRAKAKGTAGKLRLQTISQLDQRTLAAKRAHQLIAAISRDLTGGDTDQLTEGARQLVKHAAILGTMLESAEHAWLSGEPVDLNSFYTALNSQRRILVTLGLERRAKDVSPNLAQYQAMKRQRRAEEVAAQQEEKHAAAE
jgi:hypothetical protein